MQQQKEVGIVVSQKMKKYVAEMNRGDRLQTVRLVFGECVVNVVSAYARQLGSTDEENEEVSIKLETEIVRIAVEERVVLNAHVGEEK